MDTQEKAKEYLLQAPHNKNVGVSTTLVRESSARNAAHQGSTEKTFIEEYATQEGEEANCKLIIFVLLASFRISGLKKTEPL